MMTAVYWMFVMVAGKDRWERKKERGLRNRKRGIFPLLRRTTGIG